MIQGQPAEKRLTRCRHVLMLAYYFPPLLAAGTQRTVAFAKRLQNFGWKPIVLTVKDPKARWEATGEPVPAGVEVVRTREWDLLRLVLLINVALTRLLKVFGITPKRRMPLDLCAPDPQIAWFTTVTGAKIARTCDCVYASCSPFSSAVSAAMIKQLTGTPVVIDLRDAWSLNPYRTHGRIKQAVIAPLERWVISTCDALILNSPGAERLYRRRYPRHSAKMRTIPNGYDELLEPLPKALTDPFTIMHVGDFYRSRHPERLLEALAELALPDVEFVQLGKRFEGVERYAGRVRLRLLEKVTHAEALLRMRSASLLYLKQGWEPGITDYVAIATKTYEYLATGLPILAECPPGDNIDVVKRNASRAYLVTSKTGDDLKAAVLQAYSEKALKADVRPEFVRDFGRDHLTSELARVFDEVTAGQN